MFVWTKFAAKSRSKTFTSPWWCLDHYTASSRYDAASEFGQHGYHVRGTCCAVLWSALVRQASEKHWCFCQRLHRGVCVFQFLQLYLARFGRWIVISRLNSGRVSDQLIHLFCHWDVSAPFRCLFTSNESSWAEWICELKGRQTETDAMASVALLS